MFLFSFPYIIFITFFTNLYPSLGFVDNLPPFRHFNDVDFSLTELETDFFIKSPPSVQNSLKQVAHAKALMILHYQQEAQMANQIEKEMNLKVTLYLLNCSVWDFEPNGLVREEYVMSEEENTLHLLDYDCTSHGVRVWCSRNPQNKFRAVYTMGKPFGHSMQMDFICDVEEMRENSAMKILALSTITVVFILITIKLIFGIRKLQSISKELLAPPENILPTQDNNFLIVPPTVFHRIEASPFKRRMEERVRKERAAANCGPIFNLIVKPEIIKRAASIPIHHVPISNSVLPVIELTGPEDF